LLADWEEEDAWDLSRAAIIGNLNAIFVFGDMINALADAAMGKPWAGDITDIPLIEQTEGLVKAIKKYTSTTDPAKKEEALKELFMDDLPGVVGLNTKSLRRWYNNIEKLIEGNEDPATQLLRIFNFSEYQIKTQEERRPKKLTKRELKLYFPDLYEEIQEMEKLPDDVQDQLDKINEEIKQIEREAAEKFQQ
jgi:hypothetical protein